MNLFKHDFFSLHLQKKKRLVVEGYKLRIKKPLAEGGFGYVSLVEDSNGRNYALKRIIIQSEERLAVVKNEIHLMKLLSAADNPSNHIVSCFASNISKLEGKNGWEAHILMEYCNGGSLLDLINKHPQGLEEMDILLIFYQTCLAVATCHKHEPPLIHRDLKIENILRADDHTFKLCDFGSATLGAAFPFDEKERRRMEEDISKNTTMAYRSPEMVDLYLEKWVNEKADIWALGCLLFKLCFRVGPFEEGNRLQILNANYKIPKESTFSEGLHSIIHATLKADPDQRPDISKLIACVERLLPERMVERGHASAGPPRKSHKKSKKPPKPHPTKNGPSNPHKPRAPSGGKKNMNIIDVELWGKEKKEDHAVDFAHFDSMVQPAKGVHPIVDAPPPSFPTTGDGERRESARGGRSHRKSASYNASQEKKERRKITPTKRHLNEIPHKKVTKEEEMRKKPSFKRNSSDPNLVNRATKQKNRDKFSQSTRGPSLHLFDPFSPECGTEKVGGGEKKKPDHYDLLLAVNNKKDESISSSVYLTALIMSWRGFGWVDEILGGRPIKSNPYTALKAITLLHHLAQEGAPSILKDSLTYINFFERLEEMWGQKKTAISRFLTAYLNLWRKKLSFHNEYPQYSANLSLDTYLRRLSSTNSKLKIGGPQSPIRKVVCKKLLSLQAQVLDLLETLEKGSFSLPLLTTTALPLLIELVNTNRLLDYILHKLSNTTRTVLDDVIELRSTQYHSKLVPICEKVKENEGLASRLHLSSLPPPFHREVARCPPSLHPTVLFNRKIANVTKIPRAEIREKNNDELSLDTFLDDYKKALIQFWGIRNKKNPISRLPLTHSLSSGPTRRVLFDPFVVERKEEEHQEVKQTTPTFDPFDPKKKEGEESEWDNPFSSSDSSVPTFQPTI